MIFQRIGRVLRSVLLSEAPPEALRPRPMSDSELARAIRDLRRSAGLLAA